MDWFALMTRLDGRIGRAAFWRGFAVGFVALVLAYLATRGLPLIVHLVALAAAGFPLLAVLVKRLHDRGLSGWVAVLLFLGPVLGSFAGALGARFAGAGEPGILSGSITGWWIVTALVAAFIVIELGLRAGDDGYSRHGPPPLT